MNLRLAFATSTSIEPEILVADEVMGTGDAQFAAKAKKKLEEFLSLVKKDKISIINVMFFNLSIVSGFSSLKGDLKVFAM